MEDPPRFNHPPPVAPAPESPAPGQPPSHSREDSHDGGSQFSEQNPLQGDIPASRIPVEPKKPKAVALHGWQRTVGVDEDFDPTIPVCLGAPGTGLFTAKAGQNNPAAGVGVGAVVDLGDAKVTRADKKEAKSLRLQPAAPDAAPLPYPRVAAVDTASESSSEASTDDDDPTGSRKKQQQNNFETCSEASSDMSFLVNTASGSFLGNRGTFGRNIDPRIPATVGEEHLYNSLAEYFGKSRRNIPAGGAGGDAESAGGESSSRLSDLSGTAAGDKELLLRQGSGAGSSSTPLAGKAAGATPGSTTNSTTLSTSGGSGSGSTMNTNNSQTASVPVDHHQPKKKGILRIRSRSSEAGGGGGGREGESKRREGSSRGLGSGAAVATEAMVEEGRLAKQASSEAAPLEPGRRLPKCKCLRRWPWKFLSSVVTLAGLVAVVVVVVISTALTNDGATRRRLFSPQLLTANDGGAPGSADLFLLRKGWRGGGGGGGEFFGVGGVGGGGGGAIRAGLGHSRRILSVDGGVEPAAVAGDGGGGMDAGIAAAGADAGAGASAFGPQLVGEPPGSERVAATTAVDGREAHAQARAKKPAR